MSLNPITVQSFSNEFQAAVEDLVLPIQKEEFGFEITRDEQTELIDIAGVFQKGKGNFWIALDGEKLIGTIGVIDIANGQVALKKMFVHRDYRRRGVAQSLMNMTIQWCKEKGVKQIFLATNSKMIAAQAFYETNGFNELPKRDLPDAFPIASVASKFYLRNLYIERI
jgi:GNAT superfamily N-acetyltransferase